MVARGEVWWYEHPEAGRRPFAILSRDEAIPVVNQVIAVPATRTIRSIPSEVLLDESDGMPARCALSADNVTVIRRALCTEQLTRLSAERMAEVCEALRIATSC